MRISFCTTCKGRLQHLRETLPANLAANYDFRDLEFVLLNYSSPDSLDEWVRSNLMSEIVSHRVVYYKVAGCDFYVPSHAKNVAHRVASGEIVCNMDADNFSGPHFASYICSIFEAHDNIFLRARGSGGIAGRIAIRKHDFEKLGGYNEQLAEGWGCDDDDFEWRAKAMGLQLYELPQNSEYTKIIRHSNADRVKFTRSFIMTESCNKHRKIIEQSRARGDVVANIDGKWGKARLEKNFCDIVNI